MFTVKHNARTRKRGKPLLIICLLPLLLDSTFSIKWLGIYRASNILWNQTKTCKAMKESYVLNGEQTKTCRKVADAMPYVHEAAVLTVATCQHFFRYRRWNCSTIKNVPKLLPDLSTGTRERAFVHALGAAALAYTVARGCASSTLKSCRCAAHPDDPPNGNFKWGGCGDNIHYGSKFSRDFVDHPRRRLATAESASRRRRSNATTNAVIDSSWSNDDHDNNDAVEYSTKVLHRQIRLHNGDKGRMIVSESLVTHCKCHGVSGSCSIKTCWRGLPAKFHEIGEKLVASYGAATQIYPLTRAEHLESRFADSQSLLYAAASPDYCVHNPSAGSFGTEGRECNESAADAQENCESMCCGRGYKRCIVEQTERCNCKYHWCCYVSCDTCKIKREALVCV